MTRDRLPAILFCLTVAAIELGVVYALIHAALT